MKQSGVKSLTFASGLVKSQRSSQSRLGTCLEGEAQGNCTIKEVDKSDVQVSEACQNTKAEEMEKTREIQHKIIINQEKSGIQKKNEQKVELQKTNLQKAEILTTNQQKEENQKTNQKALNILTSKQQSLHDPPHESPKKVKFTKKISIFQTLMANPEGLPQSFKEQQEMNGKAMQKFTYQTPQKKGTWCCEVSAIQPQSEIEFADEKEASLLNCHGLVQARKVHLAASKKIARKITFD